MYIEMRSVLLNYARPCSARDLFQRVVYDRGLDMSVVYDGGRKVPFIEADKLNMSVMTKTEAAREKDDTFPIMTASQTKTFSQMESDDQHPLNY